MSESNQTKKPSDSLPTQLADIITELMKQNKRRSRWRRFWFWLFIAVIAFISYQTLFGDKKGQLIIANQPIIAEIAISGVIDQYGDVNAQDTLLLLRQAFETENVKAVVLRMNSPGGSPVQSSRIHDGIQSLKAEYSEKKLYVIVDDVCASGCYFIAVAGDEIYADRSSIVGSIGVVMADFGWVGAMEKLGVERRLYVAGENKALLDSFSAKNETAIKHMKKEVLTKAHQHFIDVVRLGRGDKLDDTADLFSGLVWLGERSVELGLIDAVGGIELVMDETGIDELVYYQLPKTWLEEFFPEGFSVLMNRLLFMTKTIY